MSLGPFFFFFSFYKYPFEKAFFTQVSSCSCHMVSDPYSFCSTNKKIAFKMILPNRVFNSIIQTSYDVITETKSNLVEKKEEI